MSADSALNRRVIRLADLQTAPHARNAAVLARQRWYADGRPEYHGSPEVRLVERARDNALSALGMRVLRFDHDNVVGHIDRPVRIVGDAASRSRQ